ncbi:MAG: polyphosphate kinase 2 family protein [Anaerobacillus sp.]|uniref:polyphosphate kinase 2 family protein n=1 Tax=Anaerobacillus sp. TaxID=1872506 RepID=UPI003918C6EF
MLNEVIFEQRFENKKQYKKTLKKKQLRLLELQRILHKKGVAIVLVFEGWDAAGKGGVIRRLTEQLDPRGYTVQSIAAPDVHEKQYHYFWRFWKSFPKRGQMSIFDRSWYGRILVERVEGFASEKEWKRAYEEINAIEKMFVDDGQIILKFWLHITKDEQLKRFEERQENPFKHWKLTDEDWRNRQKWSQYEEAVIEMVDKTSTKWSPWQIIGGNDKWTARVTIIEIVIEQMERKIAELEDC